MSNTRKIQMAVNIDKVAQQLVDYILQSGLTLDDKIKHKRELLGILSDVKYAYTRTGYRLPLLSALEKKVHEFSRQRMPDINEAIEMLESTDATEQYFILDVISGLLKHGNCEPSSANTQLLSRLMFKLSQYAPLESDRRLNAEAQTGFREVLRDVFISKSDQTIRAYQEYIERTDAIVHTEKPEVGKLNLSADTKQRLEGIFAKKSGPSKKAAEEDDSLRSKISENGSYVAVMARLEVLTAQRLKVQGVKNVVAIVPVTAPVAPVMAETESGTRAKRFAEVSANIGKFFAEREARRVSEKSNLSSIYTCS